MSGITLDGLRETLNARTPVTAPPTGRTEAAVAIALAPAEDDLKVLFIKRADVRGDPWSGQMAFPGGRRDAGDADLIATAIRETEEETGIALVRERLIGQLDDLAPTISVLPPVLVRPFVFRLDQEFMVHPSAEVALAVWTSLSELLDSAREVRIDVRGAPRTVPAFHIGPHVVWGMTHRIVSNLRDLAYTSR